MPFKRSEWVSGFPEREDGVVSQSLITGVYVEVLGLPSRGVDEARRALMLEVSADQDLYVFCGAEYPGLGEIDHTRSIFVGQRRPLRLELNQSYNLYIARMALVSTFVSVRAWVRI